MKLILSSYPRFGNVWEISTKNTGGKPSVKVDNGNKFYFYDPQSGTHQFFNQDQACSNGGTPKNLTTGLFADAARSLYKKLPLNEFLTILRDQKERKRLHQEARSIKKETCK